MHQHKPEGLQSIQGSFVVTKSDIGRKVVRRDPRQPDRPEEGVISSFNEKWVFVRYGMGSMSAATSPEELEYL